MSRPSDRPLREIAAYFLKLGFLGFGGPLAVMASFQRDLVEKRGWVTPYRFAQAFALIKALPGAVATQVAIFLGAVRGGTAGGIIAGLCLIAPSFLMMILIGAFHARIESFMWARAMLAGMQAAAFGVILESVWRMTRPYRREWPFWLVATIGAVLTGARPSLEPLVILGSGIGGVVLLRLKNGGVLASVPAIAVFAPVFALTSGSDSGALVALLGVFLKAGFFVFGSGLAIVPVLAHDVVDKYHWLTQAQFRDALAFGQVTPGPVLITATFIGYKVAGLLGAVVATVGVFGPAFFNMLTWFPVAEKRLGNSPYTRRFVMYAVAAVVGSILAAMIRLASVPAEDSPVPLQGALAVFALAVSLFTRIPVWVTIPAAGGASALVHLLLAQ